MKTLIAGWLIFPIILFQEKPLMSVKDIILFMKIQLFIRMIKRVYEYLWSISIKKNSFCSNFRVNLFNKIETIPFHIIKSTCVPHKLSQEFEIPKKYIDIAKSINYKEYCEFNGQYPQYKKSVIN